MILRTQSSRIKPIFQRLHTTAMLKRTAVPDTQQGRNLVISGASSCVESKKGIRVDAPRRDVVVGATRGWSVKTADGKQLVVRVERRRVTSATTFALEDAAALLTQPVGLIRIRRGIKSV